MEVNLSPQLLTPQQPQQSQQPSATNQAGATQTLQPLPDQAVTATTDTTEANAREDDALRRRERSEREQQPPLARLEDLAIQGFGTRIDYDLERERIFLEIITPSTEEVIQRIPSENLLDFLASQAFLDSGATDGAETLDQSV